MSQIADSFISSELQEWLDVNLIQYILIQPHIIEIPNFGICYLVTGQESSLLIERERKVCLNFKQEEWQELGRSSLDINYFIFQFGKNFFYSSRDEDVEFNLVKHIGNCTFSDLRAPFLGIHSGYELCSGSRNYSDWCKKAKWYGVQVLGICEENTLAGAAYFQKTCEKYGLQSIIGETVKCIVNNSVFSIKLFIVDKEGYSNLLSLNALVNKTDSSQFLSIEDLAIHSKGLVCVLGKDFNFEYIAFFTQLFPKDRLYFQLDCSEYLSDVKDTDNLRNLKKWLTGYQHMIDPVWISDAYYLDQEDAHIRKTLNSIGKKGFVYQSRDQYFKTADEAWCQLEQITSDNSIDNIQDIFVKAIESLSTISKYTEHFKILTGQKYLPSYILSKDEAERYQSNEELFYDLLKQGFEEKVVKQGLDEELYMNRLEAEIKVIVEGQVLDYFLIVMDMVRWARGQNIMCGLGRGSAAGCVVSWLLGIVGVDPIKYGLLFERFLNAGRVGKSMPDIDQDLSSARKDEVKEYLRTKYGKDYVSNIGTYGTFQLKASLKDLARYYGVDIKKTAYVSAAITDTEGNFGDFITQAINSQALKSYIKENPVLVEDFLLMLNQPKNASIHAAGMIIVPRHTTIYNQLPIKEVDGMNVSEWEGSIIEDIGFLKCDLLGLKQLDKFQDILVLIKQNHDIDVDLYNVPLDDSKVYALFQEGYNQDIFQFGGHGLKTFCKQLKPDNIEDLIATVALYRPGPIEIGFHQKYIELKNKKIEPSYYRGTEHILETTFGTLVYQEQIMRIMQDVAGFNLVETDDIRKAMGKKNAELMESYKQRFIQGAVKNSQYGLEEAEQLWNDIEGFAGYSFNRSHATCYGITGYFSQWLKANYPLEFWTVALQHAKSDEILDLISEMKKTSVVQLVSPDINKSNSSFVCDPKTNKIYWSITSIKQVGEATIAPLFEERKRNGDFFSLEDVCERIKIRKNVFVNMIMCGVLDEVEKVKKPRDRAAVLEKYYTYTKSKEVVDDVIKDWKDFQWELQQKKLCGYGDVGFQRFIYASKKLGSEINKYLTCDEVNALLEPREKILVAGIVTEIAIAETKKGENYAKITIDDSTQQLNLKLWPDVYAEYKQDIDICKGQIILLTLSAVLFNGNIMTQSFKKTIVEFVNLEPKPQEIFVGESTCYKVDLTPKLTKDKKSTYTSFFFSQEELGEKMQSVYHHRADSLRSEFGEMQVGDILQHFSLIGEEIVLNKNTKIIIKI